MLVRLGLAACLLAGVLAGCAMPGAATGPQERPWQYTDLLALDPADGPAPSLDVLALYARRVGTELRLRLDFLDLTPELDYDLYLALDHAPGGANGLPPDGESPPLQATPGLEWDTLLVIGASGRIQALTPGLSARPRLAVRVLRDPVMDTLEVSLSAAGLGGALRGVQVFSTQAGSSRLADSLGPVRLGDPRPARAPVLLAFWNTLPAYSPVQALRRWDGAHTGPSGGRHGLYNLLRTAYSHRTPLALLDLKAPASLAALDYVGGLELVQEMAWAGLLILPENLPEMGGLPAWALERAANDSRRDGQAFGLPVSPFLYAPAGLAAGLPAGRMVVARALQRQRYRRQRFRRPRFLRPRCPARGGSWLRGRGGGGW